MASIAGSQKLQVEMLAKILEAVAKTTDGGDDSLGKLLGELVMTSRVHTAKLDAMIASLAAAG